MRVKCITPVYTSDHRKIRRASDGNSFTFELIQGQEYLVVGLSILNGSYFHGDGVVYYIVDEYGRLMPVPSILFEIVDSRVSTLWLYRELENNQIELKPKQMLEPFFYDSLTDGDPQALKVFKEMMADLTNEL